MFLERLSASGMNKSKYFTDYDWNHFVGTENDLPNCVPFCLGETYESVDPPVAYKLFTDRGAGGAPVAKDWYILWFGDKGVEPKVGGVAVWGSKGSKYGHIAFVLRVEDVGSSGCKITVCQSNYKGAYFEVKEYIVKLGAVTSGVGYPYIGCCYNSVNDMRTTRNKDVTQVDVFGDYVRARKTPNGEVYEGRYCPKGLYTVLDIVSKDGYDWVKLDEDTWIAADPSWSKIYKLEDDSEAQKEIVRLKAELQELKGMYAVAKKSEETLTGKVNEIGTKLRDLLKIIET